MINKNSGQCLASQWVSGLREMSQAQKTSTEEAGDSSFDVWKSELLGTRREAMGWGRERVHMCNSD